MALPLLVNGADCGPSNPLQGLTKRFDYDRGVQQDQFGAGRAGSSKETFRTPQPVKLGVDQDAARFFGASSSPAPHITAGPSVFDLAALNSSLPAFHHTPAPQISPWASDFLQQHQRDLPAPQLSTAEMSYQPMQTDVAVNTAIGPGGVVHGIPRNPALTTYLPMSRFVPVSPIQALGQKPIISSDESLWDQEFKSQEALPKTSDVTTVPPLNDADDLARTAGLVADTVKHEQNPKFQNSQFIDLMKRLRDREAVVEGNEIVAKDGSWASDFQANLDIKGKGRVVERPNTAVEQTGQSLHRNLDTGGIYSRPSFSQDMRMTQEPSLRHGLGLQSTHQEVKQEDPNDEYFRRENEAYSQYWRSTSGSIETQQHQPTGLWNELQDQWDSFEATTTGIKAIDNYQFQHNNPYLFGDSSRSRFHHGDSNVRRHTFYESVLELEAAVQRNPGDASAWFELGVKQQENERESKAIQALRRAAELDPQHLSTWLALAVSYTNDSNRQGTYDAIKQWVDRNVKYEPSVRRFQASAGEEPGSPMEKFNRLIECLMSMARSNVSGEIDADIQIALAVLLNTNEDYAKAQDCFRTALAVRPDDWLMYNRVGATMANSGNPDEALQYYYRALELNPGYIRARFNLGISCISLRRYEDAAHHILDALVLQDSDGVSGPTSLDDTRGVTSSALWESLKTTCLHMQRVELASLCDRQDLEGFRSTFKA